MYQGVVICILADIIDTNHDKEINSSDGYIAEHSKRLTKCKDASYVIKDSLTTCSL